VLFEQPNLPTAACRDGIDCCPDTAMDPTVLIRPNNPERDIRFYQQL
jgi:hypothetical protein